MGLKFDRNDDGSLNFIKEGVYLINRIVYIKDNIGESIVNIFIDNVK